MSWLCSCSAWFWKIITRHPGLLIIVCLKTLDAQNSFAYPYTSHPSGEGVGANPQYTLTHTHTHTQGARLKKEVKNSKSIAHSVVI